MGRRRRRGEGGSGVTVIFGTPGKHSLRANSLGSLWASFTVLGPWAPRHCLGCRWLVTPLGREREKEGKRRGSEGREKE